MSIMHFASVTPLGEVVSFNISNLNSSGGGNQSVSVTFRRDGTFDEFRSIGGTNTKNWVKPKSATIGDRFQIRYTQQSGDAPTSGTLNTWQTLSSSRGIGYSSESPDYLNLSGSFTAEIRRVGQTTILDSDTFTLSALGNIP